ncbi:MAG: UDP-3-O-[3-hydroxymyristoyl] N-acetylglucosamine deacetylase [Deltaproteobacteria bacterium]|nr:UDP-3-O-[3-hydroxymyristoyl] N-acetylglucosamine deacetylase [Deltaproteobacteria bacterium]
MKKTRILIVDDEENILKTMRGSLEDEDYEVLTAKDGQEAMDKVRAENLDLIFLDIWLPGMDGMETLKSIKEYDTNLDVVLMTGHGTINTAIQAIKFGALDFLEKPLSLDNILSIANSSLERKRAIEEETPLPPKEEELIGKSASTIRIKQEINKLSKSNKNVVITGESGTGKELIARLIHSHSPKRKNPMIKFNCTLYAPEEMSQELLGTTLPSSTKKGMRKIGVLEKVGKGTLFLDSIEKMPLKLQKELVEVLKKEGKKESGKNGNLNEMRILASSTSNSLPLVKEGGFNEELYQLLGESSISLPPLRERKGDIPALLTFFLKTFSQEHNRKVKELEDEALEALVNYNWPGNIKELKNVAEKLVISIPTTKISINSLPPVIKGESPTKRSRSYDKHTSLKDAESAWKRDFLLFHLKKNDNDISTTARKLGIRKHTHIDYVESTGYATSLKKGKTLARTIEHFMAVIHAYQISNLLVKINDEIPIMDGSALDFCQLIEEAGIEEQETKLDEVIIDEKYSIGEISQNGKYISIEPHNTFTVKYMLNYPEPVGKQEYTFTLKNSQSFKSQIAPARTFGFLKDIGELEKKGLASGGRLHNFILIDDEKVVNTKLRFPDEFARHKILDLIGDFYLLGKPIKGLVTAHMTGHSDNIAILKKIRDKFNIYW